MQCRYCGCVPDILRCTDDKEGKRRQYTRWCRIAKRTFPSKTFRPLGISTLVPESVVAQSGARREKKALCNTMGAVRTWRECCGRAAETGCDRREELRIRLRVKEAICVGSASPSCLLKPPLVLILSTCFLWCANRLRSIKTSKF